MHLASRRHRTLAAFTLYFFATSSSGCNFDWIADEDADAALDSTSAALITAPPPVVKPDAATDPAVLAAETVGSIGGGGSVEGGVFRYSIPIVVPPGRLGMQPRVSLNYASSGDEGSLGLGWSLSAGHSVITRCARIHAADGISAAITWDRYDRFCLDGARLVAIKGKYGSKDSEYRTEVDQFARIVLKTLDGSDQPATWEVAFRDGRIGTYEAADALTHETRAADGTVSATKSVRFAWTMRKISDRAGNRMEYTYTANGAARGLAILPKTITYALCDSPCPYPGRARKVEFGYVDSARPRETWINGVRIEHRARLATVTTSVVFPGSDDFKAARQYRLDYTPALGSGRELLRGVKVCRSGASAARCLPATTFTWREANRTAYTTTALAAAPGAPLVTVPATEKRFDLFPDNNFGLVDLDRDGSSDVLLKDWGTHALDLSDNAQEASDLVLRGDGNLGFTDGEPFGVGAPRSGCAGREILDPANAQPVDVKGDGRVRVVVTTLESCPFLNLGSAGFPNWVRVQPGYSALRGNATRRYRLVGWKSTDDAATESTIATIKDATTSWDEAELRFGDLDGDGRPELLEGRHDDNWRWAVRLSGQETPFGVVSFTAPIAGANPPMDGLVYRPRGVHRLTDVDGDGRQELMQSDQDGTQRSIMLKVALDTGDFSLVYKRRKVTGTDTVDSWTRDLAAPVAAPWVTPNFSDAAAAEGTEYSVDINGDGLRDVLYTKLASSQRVWRMRFNTGNGYTAESAVGGGIESFLNGYPSDLVTINGVVRRGNDNGLRIADMNGDGREDLIFLDPDPITTAPTVRAGGYHGTRGVPRVAFSSGDGYGVPQGIGPDTLGAAENAWRLYRRQEVFMGKLGDLDGDGKPELVDVFGVPENGGTRRALVTWKAATGPEVITAVNDERGVAEAITYDTLAHGSAARGVDVLGDGLDTHTSDALVTQTERACNYPARCTSKGVVVAKYENFRAGREVVNAYRYEGARTDATGRGSLGFARVHVYDLVGGRHTVTAYNQSPSKPDPARPALHLYPKLAAPTSVVTERYTGSAVRALAGIKDPASGDVVPTLRRDSALTFATDTYPMQLTKSTTTESAFEDAGGTLRHERTTTTTFDEYGSPTKVSTTTRGVGAAATGRDSVRKVVVTTEYNNVPDRWLVGLPSIITTKATTQDDAAGDGCAPSEDVPCATSTSRLKLDYDANGLLVTQTRQDTATGSEKQETVFGRDAAGVVTKVTRNAFIADGEPPAARVERFKYDGDGVNLIEHTNAAGHKTWFRYYMRGEGDWVVGWKDQNGTDASALDTVFHRDEFGRVRLVATRDGASTEVSYGTGVTRETTNVATGRSTILDARGRPVFTTRTAFDGGSVIEETVYNALGMPARTRYLTSTTAQASLPEAESELRALFGGATGGTQTTAVTVDRLGRPRSVTEGVGDPTTFSYPAPLGTTRTVDPNGYVSTSSRDQDGLVRRFARTLDGPPSRDVVTRYDYDGRGLLTHIVTPDGAHDVLAYDAVGRNTTRKQFVPDRSTHVLAHRLTYDSFDDVLSNGHGGTGNGTIVVKYKHDALGRVIERRDNASGNTEVATFEWDPANGIGALGTATSRLGDAVQVTTSYEYNELHQQTKERTRYGDPSAPTLDLSMVTAYDAKGRVEFVTYPEAAGDIAGHPLVGLKLQYRYQNNELKSIADAARPDTDPRLWKADERYPSGSVKLEKTSSGLTATYDRDLNTNRLLGSVVASSSNPTLITQSFTYQKNGLPKQRAGNGNTENFKYDTLGRLTDYDRNKTPSTAADRVVASFAYDDAGNLTGVTTAASNSTDWPKADESYAYTSATIPSFATGQTIGTRTTTYVPDTAGRVKQHVVDGAMTREYSYFTTDLPKKIVEGARTTAFIYDAFGRRARKTVTEPGKTTREVIYLADLYEQHRETTPAGITTGTTLHRVFGESGVIAEVSASWTSAAAAARAVTFVHNDHQGSPAFTTRGTTVTRVGFFPFGRRQGVASTKLAAAGYTGHVQDDDLGLVNMKGRVFDTVQRRFITRDPTLGNVAHTGGSNPYSYVMNNPLGSTDPTGYLAPDTPIWLCANCVSSGSYPSGGGTIEWTAEPIGVVDSGSAPRAVSASTPDYAGASARMSADAAWAGGSGRGGSGGAAGGTGRAVEVGSAVAPSGDSGADGAETSEASTEGAAAYLPERLTVRDWLATTRSWASSIQDRGGYNTYQGDPDPPAVSEPWVTDVIGAGVVGAARSVLGALAARAATTVATRAATTTVSSGAESAMNAKLLAQQLRAEQAVGAPLPTAITGYRRHGLNQVISREGVGVKLQSIKDTFVNPRALEIGDNAFVLIGNDAGMVMNARGEIITAWALNSNAFRIHP